VLHIPAADLSGLGSFPFAGVAFLAAFQMTMPQAWERKHF
jgi:hypothetical protein